MTTQTNKFPLHPNHPERICWGCNKFCSAKRLICGNGTDRTQHPVELFGDDWFEFGHQETEPENELKASFSR